MVTHAVFFANDVYLLDSNILLYSKMNVMREHAAISQWLIDTLNDKISSVALCETSILSFLRIATNSKVFDPPLPLDDALSFITSILNRPNVHIIPTSVKHYSDLIELMKKHNFTGNLVMDAHLAVLALNTGALLVTRDKDFKKIPYLRAFNPLNL